MFNLFSKNSNSADNSDAKKKIEYAWDYEVSPVEVLDSIGTEYLIIFYLDLSEGIIKIVNHNDNLTPEREQLFDTHHSFQEAMTLYINNYVAPEYRESFYQIIDPEYLKSYFSQNDLFRYRFVSYIDGEPRNLAIKASRINNSVDKIVARVLDIASIIQSEQTQKKALQDAISVKDDFLMNMSHEFMTPLNAILGYCEIAKRQVEDTVANNEELLDSLNMIHGAGKTMIYLIQNMLNMSELMSDNIELDETPTSITDLYNYITSVMQYEAEKKEINFVCTSYDIAFDELMISIPHISRILMNLISTAIKFTDHGGTVISSMTQYVASPDTVTVEFRIKDNGIGMNEEFASQIFDLFSKEHSSTESGKSGVGLGMSITQKLVEKMNGNIKVVTKKGFGTEFTVTIPFKKSF